MRRKSLRNDTENYQEGYSAYMKGQFTRAIASYDEAIRLDPNYARAYNNRGLAYQAKGDLNRAIADFSEAIRLTPTLSAAYLNRGAAYARKGDVDKALADCTEVIRLDPHSFQAYKLRAAAYQAKGEGSKAEADRLQAGRLYRPKYDTVAHKAIKLELEVKNKDYVANYELLDSIIDVARANIRVSRSYSEEEATQILRVIDAILLQQRFITADQALLCDALVPRKLTAKILAGFDPKQLRFKPKAGDMVHFSYSFANALLYASIGEVMGFPIHIVLAPGHAFVRWSLDKFSYINWETSTGSVVTNSEYAAWRHISDAAIKNGVYAAELSPNEILASVYYELGLVWSGAWRGLENESREKGEVMRLQESDRQSDAGDRAE